MKKEEEDPRVDHTQYDQPLATAASNVLVPLREQLAALAHEQWAGWMRYLFRRGNHMSNGDCHLEWEWVERWARQVNTAYADLSEAEKDSDRKEADRVLALLESPRNVDAVAKGAAYCESPTRVSEEMKECAGGTHYKVASQAMLATWAEAVARLEQEREELKRRADSFEAEMERLMMQRERLIVRLEEKNVHVDCLGATLSEQLARADALRARAEHAEASLAEREAELTAIADQEAAKASDYNRVCAERDRLKAALENLFEHVCDSECGESGCAAYRDAGALLSSPSVKEP